MPRPTRKPAKKLTVTMPLRRQVAQRIAQILHERQITQTEAARMMRDAPSQVSLVVTGKLTGFSLDRLLVMLIALGESVTLLSVSGTRRAGKLRFRTAA